MLLTSHPCSQLYSQQLWLIWSVWSATLASQSTFRSGFNTHHMLESLSQVVRVACKTIHTWMCVHKHTHTSWIFCCCYFWTRYCLLYQSVIRRSCDLDKIFTKLTTFQCMLLISIFYLHSSNFIYNNLHNNQIGIVSKYKFNYFLMSQFTHTEHSHRV